MTPDQTGFVTLLKKEVMRFWSVLGQTVTAPVVTALLYLLVFAQAMKGRAPVYPGVDYTEFLVPGLIMMAVIQNAFANTASSLTQSKIMGNLVFLQMAPLGPLDWFGAYILAALLRRSEERRVGQECVSTCRSRWSRYHSQKHVNVIY